MGQESPDAQVDVNVNVTDNTGTEDEAPSTDESTEDNSVDTDDDEA